MVKLIFSSLSHCFPFLSNAGKVVEDHGVKVSDLTLDFFRMYNGSGVSGAVPGRLLNVESQALKERMAAAKSPQRGAAASSPSAARA